MSPFEMFRYRLRYLRQSHKMSQLELAKTLGTTQRLISHYETGKMRPNMNTMTNLAAVFNVDLDWLCGLKD